MSELFDDLVTGLNEAIECEQGKGKARTHTFIIEPVKRYNKSEIKAIRTHAGMTQAVFANYMGVSSKTVEAWEKGTNHPTGSACLHSGELSDLVRTRTIAGEQVY